MIAPADDLKAGTVCWVGMVEIQPHGLLCVEWQRGETAPTLPQCADAVRYLRHHAEQEAAAGKRNLLEGREALVVQDKLGVNRWAQIMDTRRPEFNPLYPWERAH